jgi:tetratricopeptide (TPR) repeat protein
MVEEVRRAFIDFVRAEAETHAILLILEDLHWSDPPSIKLLTASMAALRNCPFMLLGFSRPEASERFSDFWTMRELQEIRLGGLAKRAAMKLVQNALPNADESLVKRLVERADGNVLYLEELVRAAASGRGNDLPESVAAMVQARFASLPADERRVLRAASVFGGAFWYSSIVAILGGGKNRSTTLAHSIFDSLVEHEVLERRPESRFSDDKEFVFRHALLREGAYALLTETDRASCHLRAGEWLEKRSIAEERLTPDAIDGSPRSVVRTERRGRGDETGAARIAHHFELGGATSRAIEWLGRAASRALQAGDPAGAVNSAERGLELFAQLEDTPSRSMLEMQLRISHYSALMLTRGYTSPEALVSLRRAEELCPRDAPERYNVIHGLWLRHLASGDPWTGRAFAAELLALASAGKPSGVVTAHVALGMTCVFLGEHHAARDHLEAAIALFDREAHPEASLMLGADIEVFASCYLAMTYWALGLIDRGLSTLTRSVEIAERLAHPFSRASAASFGTIFFQNQRERKSTGEYAARTHALATEYGFMHYTLQSTIFGRWASADESGATAEIVSEISVAIATRRAGGNLIAIPHYMTLLVDAQLAMGRIDDALQTLDEALAITNTTGERLYVPMIYQLMGEAFIARGGAGDKDRAEDVLLRACEIAHYQNSLTMELRASVSLARLWRTVGNGREGCQRVADVLSRFTEGFESRDIQEARVLLKECNQ